MCVCLCSLILFGMSVYNWRYTCYGWNTVVLSKTANRLWGIQALPCFYCFHSSPGEMYYEAWFMLLFLFLMANFVLFFFFFLLSFSFLSLYQDNSCHCLKTLWTVTRDFAVNVLAGNKFYMTGCSFNLLKSNFYRGSSAFWDFLFLLCLNAKQIYCLVL